MFIVVNCHCPLPGRPSPFSALVSKIVLFFIILVVSEGIGTTTPHPGFTTDTGEALNTIPFCILYEVELIIEKVVMIKRYGPLLMDH